MNKKILIVFSGFNERAVISLLRAANSRNVDFSIIAKSTEDQIFLTNYSKSVYAIRNSLKLNIEDIVEQINKVYQKTNFDSAIIAPTTEALNRFMLYHKEKLKELNCSIPLVEEELYCTISNKYSFGELCKKNNLHVPKEYFDFEKAEIPFVAKPRIYEGFTGGVNVSPVIINSEKEKNVFEKSNILSKYYFQEYITGRSIYLLYSFDPSGNFVSFSQENIIQQPGGKSMIAARPSLEHKSQISTDYVNLLKKIQFWGLIMIELRKSKQRYYMIEANPRLWGPSQLFLDAGSIIFDHFFETNSLLSLTKIRKKEIINYNAKYFWYGGIMKTYGKFNALYYYDKKINCKTVKENIEAWLDQDIYNREDTKKIYIRDKK